MELVMANKSDDVPLSLGQKNATTVICWMVTDVRRSAKRRWASTVTVSELSGSILGLHMV